MCKSHQKSSKYRTFQFPQENLWARKDFPIYKRKFEHKFEHCIHTPIKRKVLTNFYIFYTSCTIGNLYTIFLQNWVETNRFCFGALVAMWWYLFRWWRRWDPWSSGRQWAPKTWVFLPFTNLCKVQQGCAELLRTLKLFSTIWVYILNTTPRDFSMPGAGPQVSKERTVTRGSWTQGLLHMLDQQLHMRCAIPPSWKRT
jgi:hypothetical protein